MVSPDGQLVAFTQSVRVPDRVKFPPGFYGSRDPDLLQTARTDGSDARPVAVGVSVGSGPRASFDPDSSTLLLEGYAPCVPTPEGYSVYMLGRSETLPFDAFDPDTGTLVPTDAMDPAKTD